MKKNKLIKKNLWKERKSQVKKTSENFDRKTDIEVLCI